MEKRIWLSDCVEIKSAEYLRLENPLFMGQTKPTKEGEYWMVFQSEEVLYKIKHKI